MGVEEVDCLRVKVAGGAANWAVVTILGSKCRSGAKVKAKARCR